MTATADQIKPDQHRPERSSVLLWVLAGLVAAALVVGAVAGALRRPPTLDPQSPEGVVQAYIEAVIDADYADAATHLSDQTASRCPASAFRQTWVPEDLTADLDDVRIRDDEAEVRVRLHAAEGPFPLADGFSSTEAFTLVRERGAWRLTDDPWPLYSCREPS